jgi:hypothetical protein
MTTKKSRELSLHDRLSRLGFLQACKLLGENGQKLIQAGARYEIDIGEQVSWGNEAFRLQLGDPTAASDVVITITRGADGRQWLLKQRLEILLGARPEAPLGETVERRTTEEAERLAYRDRVAAAGGELVGAAFRFLGQLVSEPSAPPPPSQLVNALRAYLSECVEEDAAGTPRLTVTLPDRMGGSRTHRPRHVPRRGQPLEISVCGRSVTTNRAPASSAHVTTGLSSASGDTGSTAYAPSTTCETPASAAMNASICTSVSSRRARTWGSRSVSLTSPSRCGVRGEFPPPASAKIVERLVRKAFARRGRKRPRLPG